MVATVAGLDADVHAEPDQVRCKRRQPVHLAVGEAVLDGDVLANAVAQASQAAFERFDESEKSLTGSNPQVTNPVDPPPCRLLRVRDQRPCSRRAGKRNKLTSPHYQLPQFFLGVTVGRFAAKVQMAKSALGQVRFGPSPLWVKLGLSTLEIPLPLCPRDRTLPARSVMSVSGQEATFERTRLSSNRVPPERDARHSPATSPPIQQLL
jgi:hypothetical protein